MGEGMLFEQNYDLEYARDHLAWLLEMTAVSIKRMIANHTLTKKLPTFVEYLKSRRKGLPVDRRIYIGHDEYEHQVLREHLTLLMSDLNQTICDLKWLSDSVEFIKDKEFLYEQAEVICDHLDKRYPWE